MDRRYWFGLNKETNPYGFGCWQIAGNHSYNNIPNGWGDISENQALDILGHAMDNGIDFFDTAQGYNFGFSEQLLGKAIKLSGKEVVVCTKVPLTEEEILQKKIGSDFQKRIEQSLNNLQLPFIDILLIHNPPDNIDWKDFDFDMLHHLVERKIIGTFGVSSRSLKGAKSVVENKVGTTLEWVFNLLERRPVKELFPGMEERKMNFIARSPLSRGLLNPRYITTRPDFDKTDFRSTLPKEWVDWTIHSLRDYHLQGVPEHEIVKNALNYSLQFPRVNAVILGIKTIQQLDNYLKIMKAGYHDFDFQPVNSLPEFFPKWA